MNEREALKLICLARYARERVSASDSQSETWRSVFHSTVKVLAKVMRGEISPDLLAGLDEAAERIVKNCFNSGNSLDNRPQYGKIKLEIPRTDGGSGSGNWGHAGRPGKLGGSAKRGSFGGASSDAFSNAVVSAKRNLAKKSPETAWRVTAHTQAELDAEYPGAKLHITEGGSTAAVTSSGDIISVCKNPGDNMRGKDIIALSVANGGRKLDSYSGNHGFYIKCGFEPVSWCEWNDEYAPSDWDMSKGCEREPVIFYKYSGKGKASVYKTPEDFFNAIPASEDYDAAQKARDDSM